MSTRRIHRAILAAAALAAGCTAGTAAPNAAAPAAPPPAPALVTREPLVAAAPEPVTDERMRDLIEEVARLKAQLADLRAAETATPAVAAEPQRALPPAAPPRVPVPAEDVAAADEPETVVEREVPVFIDREVPVYVDREIVVESAPAVVLERVVYANDCCDQWVPVGHVHAAGCGHHYYGCGCHPSYASLSPGCGLSFTYLARDDDDHHDGHHGHTAGLHERALPPRASPPRATPRKPARETPKTEHRAESGVARRRAPERAEEPVAAAPVPQPTPQAAAEAVPAEPVAAVEDVQTDAGRGRRADDDGARRARERSRGRNADDDAVAAAPRRDAFENARTRSSDGKERSAAARRADDQPRQGDGRRGGDKAADRAASAQAPAAAPAASPPPPPPPPPPRPQKQPQNSQKR
jgi:hypothetical protein